MDPYEPRKIIPPAGWASSSRIASALKSCIPLTEVERSAVPSFMLKAMDAALTPMQRLEALTRFAAANAVRSRAKLWHLRWSIGEMLLQTDFPDDTTFSEIPAPLPSLIIVPQRDLLVCRDTARWSEERHIEAIVVLPAEVGPERVADHPSGEHSDTEDLSDRPHGFIALMFFTNGPQAFSPVPFLYDHDAKLSTINGRLRERWSGELGESMVSTMERAAQVAFGAMLLLNDYRDLVYEPPAYHPKARGVPSVMYSQPAWIGDDDGRRTLPNPNPTATGVSRATHWRRGHWRKQRIGKGRTEVKLVWIRPILVNAAVEVAD